MTALTAPIVSRGIAMELALGFAAATVLTEIANPLLAGRALALLTIITVCLFAATTLTQLLIARGAADCLRMLGITIAIGFTAEAIGVHTGVPFGDYHYTHALGVELLGVPLVIPLAWTMMAWPALCVGRRLGSPVVLGALALASWDLFLDPQMVRAGYWSWSGPEPRLNGIPLLNQLGWIVVAIVLLATLDRALPARGEDDRLALAMWLWTFSSSLVANLVFFQRPAVAVAGGLAMGALALPLVRRLAFR